jgi:hypothetical protein
VVGVACAGVRRYDRLVSEPSRLRTAVVAVVLTVVGFAVGAGGSAWRTRDARAAPWRKMRVEHEGADGATTRTRVVFENPKLPLQAVEVVRSPEGKPEIARIALRDGTELTVRYDGGGRPSSLTAPDGSQALFSYKGSTARIAFVATNGTALGDRTLTVPAELRGALRLAAAEPSSTLRADERWAELREWLIGEAWAQASEEPISVRRDVAVQLDIRVPSGKADDAGKAEVEASCPPFACVPASPEVAMPGGGTLRIGVTASKKRNELPKAPSSAALAPFERKASDERATAARVLPDVAAVVAAVGVAAGACKILKLKGPLCVEDLNRSSSSAGGAVQSVRSHDVDAARQLLLARAEALYLEEQARLALDRAIPIQLCLSRSGFARVCTELEGRPFAAAPMPAVARSVELRRGIGGTLEGSFVLLQADGADCTFSPSPKTGGLLRLAFDNERNTVTGSLKANERGTRANLGCSLGTANMSWSQSYGATATQSFTAAELQSGGKLPLRLTGSMSGSGSYSFSNCRASGGQSANCPGGKNDGYSYRIELVGEIDIPTQTGNGRIVVSDAPLVTSGTWRVPAEKAP